jgi:hypothetical protein
MDSNARCRRRNKFGYRKCLAVAQLLKKLVPMGWLPSKRVVLVAIAAAVGIVWFCSTPSHILITAPPCEPCPRHEKVTCEPKEGAHDENTGGLAEKLEKKNARSKKLLESTLLEQAKSLAEKDEQLKQLQLKLDKERTETLKPEKKHENEELKKRLVEQAKSLAEKDEQLKQLQQQVGKETVEPDVKQKTKKLMGDEESHRKVVVVVQGRFRSLEACYKSQLKHVIEPYDADVVMIAGETGIEDKVKAFYGERLKRFQVAPRFSREQMKQIVDSAPDAAMFRAKFSNNGLGPFKSDSSAMFQYLAQQIGMDMVEGLEILRGEKFDWVVSVRTDDCFEAPAPPLTLLGTDLLQAFVPKDEGYGGINTRFAIFGRDIATAYYRIWDILVNGGAHQFWSRCKRSSISLNYERLVYDVLVLSCGQIRKMTPFSYLRCPPDQAKECTPLHPCHSTCKPGQVAKYESEHSSALSGAKKVLAKGWGAVGGGILSKGNQECTKEIAGRWDAFASHGICSGSQIWTGKPCMGEEARRPCVPYVKNAPRPAEEIKEMERKWKEKAEKQKLEEAKRKKEAVLAVRARQERVEGMRKRGKAARERKRSKEFKQSIIRGERVRQERMERIQERGKASRARAERRKEKQQRNNH